MGFENPGVSNENEALLDKYRSKQETREKVKILRSSGVMEDDWQVVLIHPEAQTVTVEKNDPEKGSLNRTVSIKDLEEWENN